jgi:exopolysaccharide biosynthesis polyprenyl glycosylphosphotransferase
MLKEQAKFFRRIGILADFLILLAAMVGAYHFRGQWGGLKSFQDYLLILGLAFPIWYFFLSREGLYASIRRRSLYDIFLSLGKVHLFGGIVLAAIIFLADPRGFSRGLFLSFLFFSFVLMSLERVVVRLGLGHIRKLGYNFRNILVVGTPRKAQKLCSLIEEHADWGLRILGFVQVNHDHPVKELKGINTLGVVQDLVDICKANPVDEVIFCPPKSFVFDAEKYLQDLEELGVTVSVALDFYELSRSRKELSLFHGEIPLLTFHCNSLDAQQNFIKRILDICGALVGLTLTGVLYPFIALAIKMESPGPVFFGQGRIGISGRTFKCWKFRSMFVDAEERKKDLLARNEMKGAIFKIREDPRITRVGKVLRQTSLDELPQFWNVLLGEMSLVGTRPPTPDEVARYENWHRRRICIKPGITGLWQVSGRNRVEDFDDIVRLDLKYIDTWSTWLDLQILFKTIWVVFSRKGSC